MKINRQTLLEDLAEFVLMDHGVIIGKPGVGKSYILRELKNQLLDRGVLTFFVPVDDLMNASDAEIGNELGLKDNWIEVLRKASAPGKKSILIFDAFDAARDENLRRNVLSQLKRAKDHLSPHWDIIVSVRTYDAAKSPDLLRLFPQTRSSSKGARSFIVPSLDDHELDSLFVSEPDLGNAFNQSTKQLKQVLHTPYFLILFKDVIANISNQGDFLEIKSIESETQLLSKYWEKKVVETLESDNLERILTVVTKSLVNEKKLTIPKIEWFEITSSSQASSFQYLRSENILDEYGALKNRIGYSHNILFDYAVCRVCLSDDFGLLLEFINSDLTRPFFLRPSFVYFFTHLWYDSREVFWIIYWKLREVKEKEIQLSVRLIPNSIIASEFSLVDDLNPILKIDDRAKRDAVLKELFQSIIFLRLDRPERRDIALIHYLSSELSFEFLWELSLMLQRALENGEFVSDSSEVLGFSARSFLHFILDKRNDDNVVNKSGWNRLGSIRGISMVGQMYKTAADESKVLFRRVLAMLKESDFDISYISSLIDNVKYITPIDPAFVAEIYLSVFGYVETSDAETSMGGGVQLNLLSNRIQDYKMCYYSLGEYFPMFVESVPKMAIPVGLTIANSHRSTRSWIGKSDKHFEFNIGNIPCVFVPDFSFVDNSWEDEPGSFTKMVTDIFEYFDRLVSSNKIVELKELFDVYIAHAQSGLTWRRLIAFGNKHPERVADIMLPLLVQPVLLASGETVQEIAEFINSISRDLLPDQLLKIEDVTLSLLDMADNSLGNLRLREQRVSRILNRFPIELVKTERGKRFLSVTKPVPNDPLVKYHSSVEPVTTESWLEDEQVDVRHPVNANILEIRKKLDAFNTEWLNGTPPRENYSLALSLAKSLGDLIKSDQVDDKVAFIALTDVAKAYAIVCRTIDTTTDSEFEIIGDVIQACFKNVSKFDQEEDASPSGGYSSTPRIEAAEALPFLAKRSKEPFLKLCLDAIKCKNSVVRFNTLKNIWILKTKYPQQYWQIIFYSLRNERHGFTAAISLNLASNYDDDKVRIEEALKIANSRTELLYDRSSFTEMFVWLLLSTSVHNNEIALEILWQNIARPAVAKQLVYKICEAIDPGFGPNDYAKKPEVNDKFINLFNLVLTHWGAELSRSVGPKTIEMDFQLRTAIEIFDSAIQQIYFSLSLRNRKDRMPVSEENRKAFYLKIKPSLRLILDLAKSTTSDGLLIPHTAYYFSQILNGMVDYEARDVLGMMLEITKYSYASGYTFDTSSMEQMVNLVEKIFADHRVLLLEKESFDVLIDLLNFYIRSGWPRAFELLWKLDDIFR